MKVGETRQVTRSPNVGLYLLLERAPVANCSAWWTVLVLEDRYAGDRVGTVKGISESWLEAYTHDGPL